MTPTELINFGMEPVTPSIIMVAGVGGGGSNAVNHMYELGIPQVTFMICNTDKQALARSPVPIKVRLGENLTEGLGAGNNPERGRAAAIESLDDIVEVFRREGTKMVFITAGMGGGTGTGAAPIIAKAACDMGILTVGIVTLPFKAEGMVRASNALEGLEELRHNVDALLVINNENIQEIYGKLPLTEAFGKADDILATAAKGIAEIITRDGVVNVDFADVSTVMRASGISLMGSGRASGEDRAKQVTDMALSSPLLNHNNIEGAKNILLNISSGEHEITMEEMYSIVEYIQSRAGNGANIIWGAGNDMSLGEDIEVTLIATGFDMDEERAIWDPAFAGTAKSRAGNTGWMPGTRSANGSGVTSAPTEAPEPCAPTDRPRRQWPQPTGTINASSGQIQGNGWQPTAPKASPDVVSPSAAAESNTPSGHTFKGIERPGRVIEVQTNSLYGDLKEKLDVPAFKRRKSEFIVDAPAHGAKSARTTLLHEEHPAEDKTQERLPFD